jgi:hypothetical protein
VRWYLRVMSAALLAAGFSMAAVASDQKVGLKGLVPETCGDHGTNVHFEKNPKDAAKKAAKDEKLVLVIHISGYFEDPDYT